MSLLPRAWHEFKAERHYERARESDTSGRNHTVMRLLHPVFGCLAVACACGEVFWVARVFRDEIVKREDFKGDHAYVVALRTQFKVDVHDVSERKARKVRGLKGGNAQRKGGWFS